MELRARAGLLRSLLIYYGRPWRTRGLRRLYATFIGPGDLAFDVGAHVGNRTRVLHHLGARVVALEPQPLCLRFLARTLPRERVHLVGSAAGRQPGRARLHVSSRHPTVSTLSDRWMATVAGSAGFEAVRWDGSSEVDVVTLDALIAEFGRPRFCKLDVEGTEDEVLAGLSEPLPMVALEYLPAALDTARACVERLGVLGRYRYNLVVGENHRFELVDWVDPKTLWSELLVRAASGRSGDIYARLTGED